MAVEIIKPESRQHWLELRNRDVTASVVGCLFGIHEFETQFSLWARKTGRVTGDDEESEAMRRGRLLEAVAVQYLRETHPEWKITHNADGGFYFRDPAVRLGATPDVLVECPVRGFGVIQIKSVEAGVYRRKWIVDGAVEPPVWIAMQAALEAHLTGADWALVAPLVIGHGIDLPEIDVPLNTGIITAIEKRVAEFWRMVESGAEPKPDFVRDGSVIAALYARSDPDKIIDLATDNRIGELIEQREAALADRNAVEARIDEIDAEVKAKLGDAEVAILPDGRRITWKNQHRKEYVVEAKTIRVLRYPPRRKDQAE